MNRSFQLSHLETLIEQDKKLLFTLSSYVLVVVMYINLNTVQSSVFGLAISILYFLINGMFLGHAFFAKEATFSRLMFGIMLLIGLLGSVGWLVMITYNLDVIRFTLVLLIVATLSSMLNRMVKTTNVT